MNEQVGIGYVKLDKKQRRMIMITVAIGTFMGPFDGSVVNIALPTISAYYEVSLATVEWVIMAYLLAISSLLLTYGRLGDIYGHKKIYLAGFMIFTWGSLLCAMAPSILMLIFFRALQAIGAGMLLAIGPAIVTDISLPGERGRALAVTAVAVSTALSTGPVIGGFLTNYFGWQSIFLINLPIGILAMLLAYKVIPEKAKGESKTQPFDVEGAIYLFLALICLLFSLSFMDRLGWGHPLIVSSFFVGLGVFLLFVRLEGRHPYPMLDLRLFQSRIYSMGSLSILLNFMATNAVVLIIPFYLQQVLRLSPAQAGFVLMPMPVANMLVAPFSGALSDRVDTRYVSSAGMAVIALSLGLLSQYRAAWGIYALVAILCLLGVGSGLFSIPNNSAILGSVAPNRRGIASGMIASMRNMGMVLGVAMAGAVFSSRLKSGYQELASYGLSAELLHDRAFEAAMGLTFKVSAVLALLGVVTSLVRGALRDKRNHEGLERDSKSL